MTNFGVYIHWPYCKSKCPYCDFFSQVKNNVDQNSIIDSYIKEIEFYAQKTEKRNVSSIFFGGGTPSLIKPKNIEKLIEAIAKNWDLNSDAEISLEANPNTQTSSLFSDLKQVGINRLSLGVQSLDDEELKFLGRTHNSNQAMQAIEDVLKIFENHSMDLIYALPQQKTDVWQKNLDKACTFGFRHLSLYQLTIEEGTIFDKKNIEEMEEKQAAEMYLITTSELKKHGYNRYEVSNYTKKGFECSHNMLYWQGDDYVGIGKSAHGRLKIDDKYFATTYPCKLEELTPSERATELLLMGLRLEKGINKQSFEQICGIDFDNFINQKKLDELVWEDLVINTKENLRASSTGFLLLNKIIEKLL